MTSPRDTMFGVIAAVAIATSCRAVASIEVVYGPISDSNLRAALKERRIGEHLRSHLIAFAPTADLRLVIADCGIANAFYRHGGLVHEIQVCAELLDQFVRQQRDTGAGARGAGGAALWVTGHELGHYLIQRHRVPLLGREEDAADQVGFAIIMRSRIPSEALIGTLRYFDRSPEHQDPGDVPAGQGARRRNR